MSGDAQRAPGTLRFLVTGGAGFLGSFLIDELHDEAARRGVSIAVRSLDLRPGMHARPVEWQIGSVTDEDAVLRACEGVDVVLHTAAMVDWGNTPLEQLRAVNVGGTETVLRACQERGVRALVHTSTMDVVMGQGPIRDGDETLPYPERPFDNYSATKTEAEKGVLAANGSGGKRGSLHSAVLRPCGMYGERDPYHMSSVLREARAGKLKLRLGDGSAVFEHVYAGNVAYGHALCAFAMLEPSPRPAGEAYFLTDQPAMNFFDFFEPFVRAWGLPYPPRGRALPTPLAFAAGRLVEGAARLLRPVVHFQPVLTRSSVHILCTDIAFRTDKAARHFGYRPRYSVEEAFERTVRYFRDHGPIER